MIYWRGKQCLTHSIGNPVSKKVRFILEAGSKTIGFAERSKDAILAGGLGLAVGIVNDMIAGLDMTDAEKSEAKPELQAWVEKVLEGSTIPALETEDQWQPSP